MGGILSAYELDGKKDDRLVGKARELADKLIHGWVDNNDIPYNALNFTTDRPVVDEVSTHLEFIFHELIQSSCIDWPWCV